MPGTTPERSYPFPVDTDAHNGVAEHIEGLALAIDDDVDEVSTTLSALQGDVSILQQTPMQVFATLPALEAGMSGAPDGSMAQAPPGIVWILIGGTWVVQESMAAISLPTIGLTYGNAPEGQTVVGSFTLPVSQIHRAWTLWWGWELTGHSADGVWQPRIHQAGVLIAAGSQTAYYNAKPSSGVHISRIVKLGNTAAETFQFVASVAGTFANTNLGGFATLVGFGLQGGV